MGETATGKSWIGGLVFSLILCVSGFGDAAITLFGGGCAAFENPGAGMYSVVTEGLHTLCVRWGLWAPLSLQLAWGLIGLALTVFIWRDRPRKAS
jgi:hypothetical protein